jgi:hypothetical protein
MNNITHPVGIAVFLTQPIFECVVNSNSQNDGFRFAVEL